MSTCLYKIKASVALLISFDIVIFRVMTAKINSSENSGKENETVYKWDIKWRNVLILGYAHFFAIFGFTWPIKVVPLIFQFTVAFFITFGTTVGAHRYFTHRGFKANKALRYFLVFLQTTTAQDPIINWVRDHRVHHKFVDTDADPYNAKRGFFFSHIGWLFVKKQKEVYEAGKKIDLSDVMGDKVLRIQKKYYTLLAILFNLLILWITTKIGATYWEAYHYTILRYIVAINLNWCVNSVSHYYGNKPYDKHMTATESPFWGTIMMGEGWHNFHHVFPSDYKTSETTSHLMNASTAVIDLFAKLGWAYDLKKTSDESIRKRVLRTGDGSHPYSQERK